MILTNDTRIIYLLQMMLTGAATKLESQFRLKWNMILNLLRVEDMSVLACAIAVRECLKYDC